MKNKITRGLEDFKNRSGAIVTNKLFEELKEVEDKVYTRDIFNRD